jgi:hypothetical protein
MSEIHHVCAVNMSLSRSLVNDRMSDRIGPWLRVVAADPMVLPGLADHPLEGAEGLTAGIADLTSDLVYAEGGSLLELSQ